MSDKFEKLMQVAKEVNLSPDERNDMTESVSAFIKSHPISPKPTYPLAGVILVAGFAIIAGIIIWLSKHEPERILDNEIIQQEPVIPEPEPEPKPNKPPLPQN